MQGWMRNTVRTVTNFAMITERGVVPDKQLYDKRLANNHHKGEDSL